MLTFDPMWPHATTVLGWCPRCRFWTVAETKGGGTCRCGTRFTETKDFAVKHD